MTRPIYALFLALIMGLSPTVSASPRVDTAQVPQFKTEPAAHKHCPGDTVVWLNTYSGIWHYKGAKYGICEIAVVSRIALE